MRPSSQVCAMALLAYHYLATQYICLLDLITFAMFLLLHIQSHHIEYKYIKGTLNDKLICVNGV